MARLVSHLIAAVAGSILMLPIANAAVSVESLPALA